MKEQVLDKIKASRFFAIQCDESTDVAHLYQLLVYSRFVDKGTVREEILFSAALETTAKAIDLYSKVDEFFQKHGLSWEKLVGVCTDGASSMIGSRSEFVKLVKEKNPDVTGTHCVIHRQSLASKTLPGNLRSSMNLAIKVVKFVKNSSLNSRLFVALCSDLGTDYKTLLFHTEVRWLSKGNMLCRLYELKNEVEIFLQKQKQDKLSTTVTNKRSRSGSRAQPNAQYEEAATLWVTDSLLSASKVNISIRTLLTWKKVTANSRTKEAQISHPVCGQNGAQQFKH
ncbi:protein of unknown function DUF4371 [Trinorchestia longiramus]|nr:protein of unknown function DUF4371 [Trinorchestia longiramus]